MEYDYDIAVSDGTILSFDEELDDDVVSAQGTTGGAASSEGVISEDEAVEIALSDAGVSASETTALSVHLDTDDGVQKYEVDFNVGTTEYNYDIDPATGAIIESDVDVDD